MIKAVLFDLDGTLVDTIIDIGNTVEKIMVHYSINKKYTYDDYKQMVGQGAKVLLEKSLEGIDIEKEEEKLLSMFTQIYSQSHFANSTPYDGINELIDYLKNKKIKLAVISNKPHQSTCEMVDCLFPRGTFDFVAGQKNGTPTKPDPIQVNTALEFFDIDKENAVYIGDSNTDILTAKNANLISIGVNWGFRGKEELKKEGADYIAFTTDDIKNILTKL